MSYRISFQLDDKDTATFLKEVGPHLGKMTVSHVGDEWAGASPAPGTTVNKTAEAAVATQPAAKAAPKPTARKKTTPIKARGSKVNDIILNALQGGTATVGVLKAALINNGMSAGSLSTGLAFLQKNRSIVRIGDGLYATYGYKEKPAEGDAPAPEVEQPAEAA